MCKALVELPQFVEQTSDHGLTDYGPALVLLSPRWVSEMEWIPLVFKINKTIKQQSYKVARDHPFQISAPNSSAFLAAKASYRGVKQHNKLRRHVQKKCSRANMAKESSSAWSQVEAKTAKTKSDLQRIKYARLAFPLTPSLRIHFALSTVVYSVYSEYFSNDANCKTVWVMHQFSNRFAGLELLSHSRQNTSKNSMVEQLQVTANVLCKIVRRATYMSEWLRMWKWEWPWIHCIAFDSFMAPFSRSSVGQSSSRTPRPCAQWAVQSCAPLQQGPSGREIHLIFGTKGFGERKTFAALQYPCTHAAIAVSCFTHRLYTRPPAKAICYLAALDAPPLQDLPGQLQFSRIDHILYNQPWETLPNMATPNFLLDLEMTCFQFWMTGTTVASATAKSCEHVFASGGVTDPNFMCIFLPLCWCHLTDWGWGAGGW